MKRSSAILVPRTFRTPYNEGFQVPMRVSSPIYEEVEFERRVEFHMSRNTERDVSYHSGSPPGPWIRNEIFREREDGKDKKDVKTEKKESKETKKDKREK